jgi:hypothetical protein
MHPVTHRRLGGNLFVLEANGRLALSGIILNLDQIDQLSDACDVLDTFNRDLPQVESRHPALNHHDASLDVDFQQLMSPIAMLVETQFHPLMQISLYFTNCVVAADSGLLVLRDCRFACVFTRERHGRIRSDEGIVCRGRSVIRACENCLGHGLLLLVVLVQQTP